MVIRRLSPIAAVLLLAASVLSAAQPGRKDLADLGRLIALVRELYPDIPADAVVRASLETLADTKESPRIDLVLYKAAGRGRIVEGVGAVLEPETQLYSGAAAFDAAGRLDSYSGRGHEGGPRYLELARRLTGVAQDEAQARRVLQAIGAPFAVTPPTMATCRPLRVVATALAAQPVASATRGPLVWTPGETELWQTELAWQVNLSATRGQRTVVYRVRVDSWGEVLSVSREGRPFP
jgi:hypothetical protein